ncbi:hypothetical protein [Dickeya poaceiphila]|uniref:Uncharacterized protein n=1 Tax=Dickeya poaceiphila TaxID=568768 RepID=A0A5B8I6T6_9GAMM|nr:hypothetical protein [Dickeya poaceiphila]QDX30622.1 hypothetical protein Dpoa569_0002534 [Dickeya poaceiphila]
MSHAGHVNAEKSSPNSTRQSLFEQRQRHLMIMGTLPVMLFGSIWLLSLFDYNLPVVNAVEKYHRWKK